MLRIKWEMEVTMPDRSRDAAYTAFVTDQRGPLLGVAYLMYGSRSRAYDVVSVLLAQLYNAWATTADPRRAALKNVLTVRPDRRLPAWHGADRIELVDGSASRPVLPTGVVADLAQLADDARRVVILQALVGLTEVEIAAVLGQDPARVRSWARVGVTALAARKPERASGSYLAEELAAAVAPDLVAGSESDPGDDVAHGRELRRQRLLRRGLVAVVVVLVAVLGVTQLPSLRPDPAGTDGAATAVPTPAPTPTCDTREKSCRADLARDWRLRMARVATSYVDPEGTYFSGYTYSYDRLYDSPGIWTGQGGVLGFDLFRLSEGGTDVYVQIATSPRFALRCGQQTHQTCAPQQFMDGNVFTMTNTSYADQGLEVQYSPLGNEVITVVARNTSKGPALRIGRAELVNLVLDPRLRLPPV